MKIFSHSIGCLSVLMTVIFALQKLLSFRRNHLLVVSLSVCPTGIFSKWSPMPKHSSVLPTLYSMRFRVFFVVIVFVVVVEVFDTF